MAKHRTSFGVADLASMVNAEQEQVQEEKHEDAHKETIKTTAFSEAVEGTQGKKGCKRKRINMAFSDANYRFIEEESRRRGVSMTMLVNAIIVDYRGRLLF